MRAVLLSSFSSCPASPTHAELMASASRFVIIGHTRSMLVLLVKSSPRMRGELTTHHA
jgi:hypothetical protein